jgi:hypothetical protein
VGGVVAYRYFFIAGEDRTLTFVISPPDAAIITPKPKSEESFSSLFDEIRTRALDVEMYYKNMTFVDVPVLLNRLFRTWDTVSISRRKEILELCASVSPLMLIESVSKQTSPNIIASTGSLSEIVPSLFQASLGSDFRNAAILRSVSLASIEKAFTYLDDKEYLDIYLVESVVEHLWSVIPAGLPLAADILAKRYSLISEKGEKTIEWRSLMRFEDFPLEQLRSFIIFVKENTSKRSYPTSFLDTLEKAVIDCSKK